VIEGLTVQGVTLSKPYRKYSFIQRYQSETEHGRIVAREIRSFHPDLVLSADTPLDAQIPILRASKKEQARFIFWFQDAISIAIARTLYQKWIFIGDLIGEYYQWLEQYLLRASDKVILISEDFQPLMNQWHISKEKQVVIPNWMPLKEITPGEKQNSWSIEHELQDKFCFIYTGILGLKHDTDVFIHLAEHFCAHPEVCVLIVSEGEKADELKKKAIALNLPNLVVLPFQSNAVFDQVLGTADVLVSVLNHDAGTYSVPSKVLTYLCSGKPILLSLPLENAAAKMVALADAGLISAPDNVDLFIQNAQKLYTSSSLREQMGHNGRTFAEKQFNIDTIIDQFKVIF
jgi:glycosyltransferase involved in cell wall biosynthesis